MRKKSKKTLKKECDKLWADCIKYKAKRCEYCGKSSEYLNAHHIFGRNALSTRFDLSNGICLCAGCHIQIAHQKPLEFSIWLIDRMGRDWYQKLKNRHYENIKIDFDMTKSMLEEILSDLKKIEGE